MNTDRIKEIQKETAYPESRSVQQALLKVWNECENEKGQLPIQRVSDWVAISERLPEYNKPVLVYSESRGIVEDELQTVVNGEPWFNGTRDDFDTNVTYWMPSPGPPCR